MIKTFTAVVLASLAGCAAQGPRVVHLSNEYDSAAARRMVQPGPNTIVGSALIRQRGGGVVTCAGSKVTLLPATRYAEQRVAALYGGAKFSGPTSAVRFEPDPPDYQTTTRTTTCNAQGFFRFDNVADGSFFIHTVVSWQVGYNTQGGALIDRVSVEGGQVVERTLTP